MTSSQLFAVQRHPVGVIQGQNSLSGLGLFWIG
jgi:hypothetical protein